MFSWPCFWVSHSRVPQSPEGVREVLLDWPGKITASTPPGGHTLQSVALAASDTGSVANHCNLPDGSTHELTFNHRQGAKFLDLQGPDGNMWFTQLGADKLGKVTLGKGK